jgi:signal transduction histidine kinase
MRDEPLEILLVSKDEELARRVRRELPLRGCRISGVVAALPQARTQLRKLSVDAILLDESALGRRSWPAAVRELVPLARVVCLVATDAEADLAGLEEAYGRDVVVGRKPDVDFVPRLVQALQRCAGHPALEDLADLAGAPEGFGEILRHEMNNPLTGILGNAELLLARRESLPPAAVQRLQTIADLAVRLRETIRRLSNAWESEHPPQARSA